MYAISIQIFLPLCYKLKWHDMARVKQFSQTVNFGSGWPKSSWVLWCSILYSKTLHKLAILFWWFHTILWNHQKLEKQVIDLNKYIWIFFIKYHRQHIDICYSDKPINTISTSKERPRQIRPWMTWKPWRHMSDAKAHTIESQQLY